MTSAIWLRRIGRSGLGVILILGCTQIFGIDEACVVDNACGIERRCAEYCERIEAKCVEFPQYDHDKPECEALCAHFPLDADAMIDDANTFECRLARATNMTGEARLDCFAAGRGGQEGCGSNCESYCSLMQAVCPSDFAAFDADSASAEADLTACRAECDRIGDTGEYDPEMPGEFDAVGMPTVQCRLWHLGAAAIDLANGLGATTPHCQHAAGFPPCVPAPPPPPQ